MPVSSTVAARRVNICVVLSAKDFGVDVMLILYRAREGGNTPLTMASIQDKYLFLKNTDIMQVIQELKSVGVRITRGVDTREQIDRLRAGAAAKCRATRPAVHCRRRRALRSWSPP